MLCRNLHKEGAIGAPSGHYSDAEIADTKVKAEALAADVEAEGTVLVRNNDNTLPLAADNKKINVFGWASTAWLGGGSGSGGVSGVNTDLLAALTVYGVAYNTELTDMYKDFQDGREYTRTLSAWPEQSGRLYEPDINNQTYYTQSMLDNAKSNEHGTGYAAVEVNGTSAPNPYAGKALPHYTSGKVQRVPDDEWEILLSRPIPADTVKIDRNMTLGELNHSRSPLCWLVWAVLTMLLNASYKRGKPNLNVMFQYNMPLRALAKMTNGAISMGMVDGVVLEAKGFWVIGLLKVIVEAVKNIILNAQLESRLCNS